MSKKAKQPFFDCSVLPELAAIDSTVAGIDEVGRGALFGPVVAAVVVFSPSVVPQLTQIVSKDSKQLSPKQRFKLSENIKNLANYYRIGYASSQEIDQINILQASLLAMKRSLLKLKTQPTVCLVDGRQKITDLSVTQYNLVKGDERTPVIAAASILAKVWRDDLIVRMFAALYPDYDLAANKGYGTEKHLKALLQYGPSPHHRMSFSPCRILGTNARNNR